MKYLRRRFLVVAFSVLGMSMPVWSQADYMPPLTGTPLALWQIQGEYYGTIAGGGNLGAWLVANGNNSYTVVFLPGGLLTLPGQPYGGWTRTGWTRPNFSGTATLTGTTFVVNTTSLYRAAAITGTGAARVMTGTTPTNAQFTLNRVMRNSPTYRLRPLAGATSYFDSATGAADLTKWTTKDNAVQLKYNYLFRGIQTVAAQGSGFLHIESMGCFNPTATGQGRANAGVYMQGRYEAQTLDSFGLNGTIDEFGSIYATRAPSVNSALPPLTFQTYDIYFTMRTSGVSGDLLGAATMSVYANGVLVQDSTLVPTVTTAGTGGSLLVPAPLYLQNHNNEVVYNNIWWIPNATRNTLPWTTVLNAAVGINRNPTISPLIEMTGMRTLGLNGIYDMVGRKIQRNGAVLSIQPTVLANPLNP